MFVEQFFLAGGFHRHEIRTEREALAAEAVAGNATLLVNFFAVARRRL